jgi:hypothetical protein
MSKPNRRRLPNRRLTETRKLVTPFGQTAYVSVGYDPATPLKPYEVFYSGGLKSGSDLEYHLQDLCVLISLLLQVGQSVTFLTRSISRRASALGGEEYASLAGWLLSAVNEPPSWTDEVLAASNSEQIPTHSTSCDAKENSK